MTGGVVSPVGMHSPWTFDQYRSTRTPKGIRTEVVIMSGYTVEAWQMSAGSPLFVQATRSADSELVDPTGRWNRVERGFDEFVEKSLVNASTVSLWVERSTHSAGMTMMGTATSFRVTPSRRSGSVLGRNNAEKM